MPEPARATQNHPDPAREPPPKTQEPARERANQSHVRANEN